MSELPYAKRTPWLDRAVSKLTARLLVWSARRAKARNDGHEFRHIQAAVRAGNSQPCEESGRCHLNASQHPPLPSWHVGGPAIRGD